MIRTLCSLLLLLCSSSAFSQYYTNQNKVWQFGNNVKVDFNSGSPVTGALTGSTTEGCASVCDATGALLFYTNGKNVYNSAGSLMPHGTNIVTYNTLSTSQAAVIAPVLGSSTQYYIFSQEQYPGGHLSYSIVDMSLASGLGDLVTGSTGIALGTNMSEKMTIVAGNSCNLWLLVHGMGNSNFYAYEITTAGLNTTPVVSTAGTSTASYAYAIGVMKVSPNRLMIALANYNLGGLTGAEICDFDPTTGMVSNNRLIDGGSAYGAEFSPDNTKLYMSGTPGIYQFDVSLSTTTAIASSKTAISSSSTLADLKLASDDKIYIIDAYGSGFLNRINSPNIAGTSCGFASHAVTLTTGTSATLSLPNIYYSVTPADTSYTHHDTTVCLSLTGSVVISAHDSLPYSGHVWDDGTTTTTTRTITAAGTYWVRVYNGCSLKLDTIHVTAAAVAAIAGPSRVCAGQTISMTDATPGGLWSSSAVLTATAGSATGIVTGVASGTAIITYTVGGCGAIKPVTVDALPGLPIGGTNICAGATATFFDGTPGGTWSTASTNITIGSLSGTVTGLTTGPAVITYALPTGCRVTLALTVNPSPSPITGALTACAGNTLLLGDVTPGGSWTSSNMATATIGTGSGLVTTLAAGTSAISYTLPGGCAATATITVNVLPLPISGPATVCLGQTAGLTCGTGGGTWSSSLSTTATVSSTGVVTGVAMGTATITYTLPTGCRSVFTISVAPLPGTITGSAAICAGSTRTLADTTAGGTWTSSNYTVAYVDPVMGELTGYGSGTAVITYTSAAGCITTRTVSVEPAPAAIAGPTSLCTGGTATLYGGGSTWTATPATIAIVSPVGVVYGVAAGVAVVTCTSSSGCYATLIVTVNPSPLPITGGAALCLGTSITLTDGTPGGAWTSSSPSVAGVAGGYVTAGTPGTTVISYTVGGCAATITITVNSAPPAISGPTQVCMGSNITLADAAPGGHWSTTATTVSLGTATGVVTGLAAGLATITYAIGTSCTATSTIVVNPLPVAPSGTLRLCAGSTTVLASPGGGTWTSGNTAVATTGSASGIVTGVNMGTAPITYTLPTGCARSVTVTVNALPALFNIAGGGSLCAGGAGVHIGLANSMTGTTYQLMAGTIPVVTLAGTGGALDFGAYTGAGTYTVVATITATGCSRAMTGTAVITLNPAPMIYSVTGGGSFCAGGAGLHIGLSGSAAGVTYRLFNGTSPVVSLAGTGSGLDFGLQAAAGVYTVVATSTAGCTQTMAGSATLTVNPLPAPIGGPTAVCIGATITATDAMPGGTWASSTMAVGTVNATGVVAGLTAGTTTISYTLPTGCMATATVTVSAAPLPISGTASVCTSLTTALSDVIAGGLWTSGNPAAATVGSLSGVVTGIAPGTAVITYSLGSGCTVNRTVTVNAGPAAISGAGSICIGTTTPLTDGTPGGVWSSSALPVATVSGSGLATGVAAGTATISYSVAGCAAIKTITVNPTPGVITVPSVVCIGSSVAATNGTIGGVWSTASATLSIGSASGMVTGMTAGAGIITYAIGTCTATRPISVNANPVITGSTGLCTGTATTLTASMPGGTWGSSSPAIATIGVTTGLLTGMAPGTAIITYNSPSGCHAAVTITVNSAPGAITGVLRVCTGSTTALTNTTGGGLWSISPVAVAAIGSLSGTVTGTTTGTATVTYSLGSGCTVTASVTVNPAPAPITGTLRVCTGSTVLLADATAGGAWSSAAASAAINITGTVTGMTDGTAVISYTLPTGCAATATVTVNASPLAITGPASICTDQIAAMTDVSPGGTWTISPAAVAMVGSGTGMVTGTGSGTAIITYTLPTGCLTTKPISVNGIPPAITGPSAICIGASAPYTDAAPGGAWSSTLAGIAAITPGGVVTGAGLGAATISYTVGGCAATKVVSINPLPAPIAGPDHVCAGGTVLLTEGVSGTWTSSSPFVATVGSASGVVTGVIAGATIITFSPGAGCQTTKTVTVNGAPAPITGVTHACVGGTSALGHPLAGGVWSSGNIAIATISTGGLVTGITGGTVSITYLPPTGCPAIAAFNVIAVPPITGIHPLCAWGDTMTVYNTNTTGIYTSSLATITNLGMGSGRLLGNAPGVATVTYYLPSGCYTSATFTVNALPAAITGAGSMCAGGSRTLADATPGGYWSTTTPLITTVGSSSGIVTAVGTGTGRIRYTITATGCKADTAVVISVIPAAITGPASVFIGSPAALSNAVPGGIWASSNTARATISTTGIVTGVSVGAVVMSYTIGGACYATKTINVMPPVSGHKAASTGTTATVPNSISIIPNPNEGAFMLELQWGKEEPLQISITDMAGRNVIATTITTASGAKQVPLQLQAVPGMYLLTVVGSDYRYTARVVVQ